MKYVRIALIAVAVCLIIYNSTLLNKNNPLEGDSLVAMIGIISALCALLLLLIVMLSKKIERKTKNPHNHV